MAVLVTYSNPLDPLSRVTSTTTAQRSSDLVSSLAYDATIYDVVVARNDEIVDADFEIVDGDIVAVILVPKGNGGKNIIRVVAMIALAVVAPQLATGLMWTVGSNSAFLYYTAMAATMVAGSYAINAVLPPPTTDLQSGLESSQTYGWQTSSNVVAQGTAVPKLYGTMRVTPPLISHYIETIGDKQYLNCLYAVSDGELSSITDIKINDNSIANYDGVTYEVRLGSNTQSVIPSFDNTKFDQMVSNQQESGADWDYCTTQGDSVSRLTVALSFPAGLFSVDKTGKDAGSIRPDWWHVYAQYSSDGLNWTDFPECTATGYREIGDQKESPFRATMSTDTIPTGQYTVRIKGVRSAWPYDFRHDSTLWWEYLEEEIADDFGYPNTALLAIRALATDQLSGQIPTVTCLASTGDQYESWSGAGINANPAQIAKAILQDAGVTDEQIDTTAFTTWLHYCDTNSFECNMYLDSTVNVRKALDLVSACGRARVEQFGSRFSVIVDMPEAVPTQGFMFGMGNILKDSFKEEFLPVTNRANVVEITYYDKDKDYERTVAEVSNDSYDNEAEENRISIDYIGCTDRDMALRYAKYRLNCNRYLTNTASWEADIDALVCRVGDVVQVSHDVPQWGESGRLEYGSTTGCRLDRDVVFEAGKSYAVMIKYNSDNSVVERAVTLVSGTTDTLLFTVPVTTAPTEFDLYSFGEVGKITKLMRIVSMSTSGNELQRKISAIEYVDGIYDDTVDIGDWTALSFGITMLRATKFVQYNSDGSTQLRLKIEWNGSSTGYTVGYKLTADAAWVSAVTYDNFFYADVAVGEYTIRVTDANGSMEEIAYTVSVPSVPEDVTGFTATWDASGQVIFAWDKSISTDTKNYEIRIGASWEFGANIIQTSGTTYTWTVTADYASQNLHCWIKAISASSLYSENATEAVVATGSVGSPKYSSATLYQWSTATPSNPSGESTYDWVDGSHEGYTGTGNWSVIIGENPGTPGIKLWACSKPVAGSGSDATTTVSWTSGYTISAVGANGVAGVQSAKPTVYQWASTIPSEPTGTSTYAWSTGLFGVAPTGWSLTPGTSPSAGYTLWAASVSLVDSATVATSSINWTTASIAAVGYSGTAGASARVMYARIANNPTPTSGTVIVTGDGRPTQTQSNGTWGLNVSWSATDPDPSSTYSLYQADGIYNPATSLTVWSTPYLSSLKVGALSAITANLGTVNAGTISGAFTANFSSDTGYFYTVLGKSAYTDALGATWDVGGLFRRTADSKGPALIAEDTSNSPSTYAFACYSFHGGAAKFSCTTNLQGTNVVWIAGSDIVDGDALKVTGDYAHSGINVSAYVYSGYAGTFTNMSGGDALAGFSSNGIGVLGKATSTTSAINHAIRGSHASGTSGLVGPANGYDFYAEGTGSNYGPFTGAHDVLVEAGTVIDVGYIVMDTECVYKKSVSNCVFKASLTTEPRSRCIGIISSAPRRLADMQPAVFIESHKSTTSKIIGNDGSESMVDSVGVVMSELYESIKATYDGYSVNAVGEGQLYVCGENGDIAAGDLIVTSSMPGVGMRQDDDIIRSYTVAKAREAMSFSATDEKQLVACIYLCG